MNTSPFLLKIMRNDRVPLRLRKKLGKALGAPASGIGFEIKLFETLFEGKTGNHLDNKIYYYGSHEPATLDLIRTILSKQSEPVYLDIGTNIGQHLMIAAPKATKAFGFEPWDRVRDIAHKNLQRNNLTNAQILPFGLGEAEAQLPFLPPPEDNLGNGLFVKNGGDERGTITLHIRRGDDVMGEMDIRPTLIKIDTEGFEAPVLRGLTRTLEKYRPTVIFELGKDTRKDFPSTESMMAAFPKGYSLHGILPSRTRAKVVPFCPKKRFENLVAWPEEKMAM